MIGAPAAQSLTGLGSGQGGAWTPILDKRGRIETAQDWSNTSPAVLSPRRRTGRSKGRSLGAVAVPPACSFDAGVGSARLSSGPGRPCTAMSAGPGSAAGGRPCAWPWLLPPKGLAGAAERQRPASGGLPASSSAACPRWPPRQQPGRGWPAPVVNDGFQPGRSRHYLECRNRTRCSSPAHRQE